MAGSKVSLRLKRTPHTASHRNSYALSFFFPHRRRNKRKAQAASSSPQSRCQPASQPGSHFGVLGPLRLSLRASLPLRLPCALLRMRFRPLEMKSLHRLKVPASLCLCDVGVARKNRSSQLEARRQEQQQLLSCNAKSAGSLAPCRTGSFSSSAVKAESHCRSASTTRRLVTGAKSFIDPGSCLSETWKRVRCAEGLERIVCSLLFFPCSSSPFKLSAIRGCDVVGVAWFRGLMQRLRRLIARSLPFIMLVQQHEPSLLSVSCVLLLHCSLTLQLMCR